MINATHQSIISNDESFDNKFKVRNYMSQLSQVVIEKKMEASKFRNGS
jgi:hypothetical protein